VQKNRHTSHLSIGCKFQHTIGWGVQKNQHTSNLSIGCKFQHTIGWGVQKNQYTHKMMQQECVLRSQQTPSGQGSTNWKGAEHTSSNRFRWGVFSERD
jgi:hypothetical protein